MERRRQSCGRTVWAILMVVLSRFTAVSGQNVTVATPVASQLSHPARIGQEFDLALSPNTFENVDDTSSFTLNYGASHLPTWLAFDPSSRTFRGTPTPQDSGTTSIEVTACDGSGTILASDTFDLTVTNKDGNLSVVLPLVDQFMSNDSAITSAYPYPPESPFFPGVRVPPNWSFSLGFQSWMYATSSGSKVYYSASLADGSPLPGWLYFNNNSVTFDGVTPGATQGKTFQIVLAGSDVLGYRDAVQGFNITISAYNLTAVPEEARRPINITADGGAVDTMLDLAALGNLRLDGSPVKTGDIASFQVDLASSKMEGLDFAVSNSSFVGYVNMDMADKHVSVPLNVVDKWGDVLNTTLDIAFVPSSFKQSQLPPSILTPGQDYKVDLKPFLMDPKSPLNLTTTFEPAKASSFISLNDDQALVGKVPSDVDYDSVIVTLLARSGITNATSRAEILLSLTGNGTEPATLAAHPTLSPGAIIAIGVVSSIAGAILILGLLLLLVRKLRKRRAENDKGIGYQVGRDRDDEAEVEGWRLAEYRNAAPEHDGVFSDKESRSPSLYVENGSGVGLHDVARPSASPVPASVPLPPSPGLFSRLNPFSRQRSLRQRRLSGSKISKPIIKPDFGNAAYQAQLAHSVQIKNLFQRKSTLAKDEPDATPTIMVSHDGDAAGEGDATRAHERAVSPVDSLSTHRSNDTTLRSDSRACDSPVSLSCYDEHADSVTVHSNDARGCEPEGLESDDHDSVDRTLDTSAIVYDSDDQSAPPWTKQSRSITPRPSPKPSLPCSEYPSSVSPLSQLHPRTDHTVVTPPDDSSGQDIEISIRNIHFPTDSDIAGTETSSDAAILEEAVIGTASMVPARSASNRSTLESPVTTLNSPAASDVTQSTLAIIPPRPSPIPSRLVEFNKHKTVQVTAATDQNQVQRNVSHTVVIHNSRSANSSVADHANAGHGGTTGSILTEMSVQTTGDSSPAANKVKARPRRKTLLIERTATPPSSGPHTRQPLGSTDLNTPSPSPPSGLPKSLPSLPNIETLLKKPASHRILLGVDEPFHFYPPLNYIVNGRSSVSGKPEIRSDASYIAQVESSYRKDVSMYPLPSWLKFEDMELWGVPVHTAKGDWTIRIMEYLHGQERVVGRFTLEVVPRDD